jgi:hypothetical protein
MSFIYGSIGFGHLTLRTVVCYTVSSATRMQRGDMYYIEGTKTELKREYSDRVLHR